MNSQLGNLFLWVIVAALAVIVIQSTTALPEESYRLKRIFCNFDGCGNGKRSEDSKQLVNKVFGEVEKSKRRESDVYTANEYVEKDSPKNMLLEARLWNAFLDKMRSSRIKKRHVSVEK